MATRAQKTKVGIFVVSSLTIIVVAIMIIMGYTRERFIPYWVEFDESILGLGEGSPVVYLGVPVGTVDEIYVTEDFKARVRIEVSEETVTLREGVTGQLALHGIATGAMCVSLKGGDPDGPELEPGETIPTEPSLIEAVSSQVEGILYDVGIVAGEIRQAVEGLEEGELRELTRDFGGLISDTRNAIQEVGETIEDMRSPAMETVDDLRALAQEVTGLAEDTRGLLRTAEEGLGAVEITETQQKLNLLLDNVAELTDQLMKTTTTLDDATRKVSQQTDNVELYLREGLRNLTETLESIRRLTDYLQEDPSAVVRGRGRPQGER